MELADLLAMVPDAPGVYVVYDEKENLQYVGISRRVATSVAAHVDDLPELAHSVRVHTMPGAGKGAVPS